MTTRWARFARGWFAAVFSTFVAAFSHAVAGGGHPPLFAIAVAVAFSGIVCVFLAGRRLSRLRLAVSVLISQFFYHSVFEVFGSGGGAAGTVVASHHGTPMVISPAGVPDAVAASGADGWMLLAHVAAAALTIAVLLYGERVCRGLGELARLAITALTRRIPRANEPIPVRSAPAINAHLVIRCDLSARLSSLRHRGPPALAGAV